MSEIPLTIRLKIGEYEMELTGSRIDVMNTLDELPKIAGKIIEIFPLSETSKDTKKDKENTIETKIPSIVAKPGISCPDAITTILSTEWGRVKPRNLRDILEAMKVNALHFPTGTVKGRLTDLTKKGALRRIRGEKGYGYVVMK